MIRCAVVTIKPMAMPVQLNVQAFLLTPKDLVKTAADNLDLVFGIAGQANIH
jgi:hypothetical protein